MADDLLIYPTRDPNLSSVFVKEVLEEKISLSVFLPKCRQMMSRRYAVTSHDVVTSCHDVTP